MPTNFPKIQQSEKWTLLKTWLCWRVMKKKWNFIPIRALNSRYSFGWLLLDTLYRKWPLGSLVFLRRLLLCRVFDDDRPVGANERTRLHQWWIINISLHDGDVYGHHLNRQLHSSFVSKCQVELRFFWGLLPLVASLLDFFPTSLSSSFFALSSPDSFFWVSAIPQEFRDRRIPAPLIRRRWFWFDWLIFFIWFDQFWSSWVTPLLSSGSKQQPTSQ